MLPKEISRRPQTMNELREVNSESWQVLNGLLHMFYCLFKAQGNFYFWENTMGIEGSYEHFEHLFDDGYFIFTNQVTSQGNAFTIWIWDEVEQNYSIPQGPNTIIIN